MWNQAYLECHDTLRHKQRFYAIHITQTIFGEWALIKEWGRIGSPGTVREEWFDEESQAINKAHAIVQHRVRRGYCLLS
ncbi:MAG: WGR domain-containing protein [Methylomonas sp.]|jgi:predicted DNA-binding WGR domain protein